MTDNELQVAYLFVKVKLNTPKMVCSRGNLMVSHKYLLRSKFFQNTRSCFYNSKVSGGASSVGCFQSVFLQFAKRL